MEPNGDSYGDAGTMDKGESPPKPDDEMVYTKDKEGRREVDEPMEEGEQGGDAKPTEYVKDKPATPDDTSVAGVEKGKSD